MLQADQNVIVLPTPGFRSYESEGFGPERWHTCIQLPRSCLSSPAARAIRETGPSGPRPSRAERSSRRARSGPSPAISRRPYGTPATPAEECPLPWRRPVSRKMPLPVHPAKLSSFCDAIPSDLHRYDTRFLEVPLYGVTLGDNGAEHAAPGGEHPHLQHQRRPIGQVHIALPQTGSPIMMRADGPIREKLCAHWTDRTVLHGMINRGRQDGRRDLGQEHPQMNHIGRHFRGHGAVPQKPKRWRSVAGPGGAIGLIEVRLRQPTVKGSGWVPGGEKIRRGQFPF